MSEIGTVKRFFDKGYGFITPDSGGEDIFVGDKNLRPGYLPKPGDRVIYDVVTDRQGRQRATNVRPA